MDGMIDTVLIDGVTPECRVALLNRSSLIDFHVHRPGKTVRAGDVIMGRVKAVVPSVQGAFVEIGDHRDGFLSFPEKTTQPPVREGEAVIVQVRHQAMAEKGARLTSRISLQGRYVVYTPDKPGVNASRKAGDPELAHRAVEAVKAVVGGDGGSDGAIIRTAALLLGADGTDLAVTEVASLRDAWQQANVHSESARLKPPHCLISALDPVFQMLLDLEYEHVRRIVVEGSDMFLRVRDYLERSIPELLGFLESYQGASSGIMEVEGVEEAVDAALRHRVALPSGGCLHIHETPACVTIDVDTDSAASSHAGKARDLIRHTNAEAADALMHALRLRNLSGLIVVDFICDGDRDAGRSLLEQLSAAASNDPYPIEVAGFTRSGLVEMTRRRRSTSLPDMLMDRTASDSGSPDRGKSVETMAYDALRRLHHGALATPGKPLSICASADVIALLQGGLGAALREMKASVGVAVTLEIAPGMRHDMMDVYSS